MIIWVCGRYFEDKNKEWEILGAYSDEQGALDRCTQCIDFVAPLILDKSLPEELTEWPGFYYPSEEKT